MCHYITATIPRAADTSRFRKLVEKHGLAFEPISNSAVEELLRPGEAYFHATREYCDCGTSLVRSRSPSDARSRKVQQFRRRGWSEAKIERWLQSTTPGAKDHGTGPTQGEWQAFIVDVLAAGVPYVGLLVHWYRGSLSDEPIAIKRRVAAQPTSLPLADGLDEDMLYCFALDR